MTQNTKDRVHKAAVAYLSGVRMDDLERAHYLDTLDVVPNSTAYAEYFESLHGNNIAVLWDLLTQVELAALSAASNRVGRALHSNGVDIEIVGTAMTAVIDIPDPKRADLIEKLDDIIFDPESSCYARFVTEAVVRMLDRDPMAQLRVFMANRSEPDTVATSIRIRSILKEAGL